ncbi:D-inositol 3-phosphate glycosyltransferase [Dyella sp. AD56]|uniref:glycosyltransferase n=1 Tax=Dyella sp. AD56 TaxID=1528744 RepID=UPI000C822449|nr:glycosyltransferase [Dyella sp. AD56]PMQ02587.1 D-inositol 3-phosphate glycosyltransferase [Dyella sp. AD56]
MGIRNGRSPALTGKERQRDLKVLNVAETIKGGVATYLAGLEAGQAALGWECAYLIPGAQSESLKAERVFAHDGSRSPAGLLRLAIRTIAMQKRYRADVVFAHSSFAGAALCLARPFLGRGVKTLYCPHGWAMFREMAGWKRSLIGLIERSMSFVPTRVINISQFEHDTVLARGFAKRCVLIPNAVADVSDRRIIGSSESGRLRVLFVGRFDRQKGLDTLIEAIRLLDRDRVNRLHFDLVGESVLGDGTHAVGDLLPHVTRHGWLTGKALQERYAEADILVMPSRWEGFGLCAIEALRAGTPVLARRVGALSEIVTHGVDGFLFDGGAKELRDALMNLDAAQLQAMRVAARMTFESRYRLDRLHRQYREMFARLGTAVSVDSARGRAPW